MSSMQESKLDQFKRAALKQSQASTEMTRMFQTVLTDNHILREENAELLRDYRVLKEKYNTLFDKLSHEVAKEYSSTLSVKRPWC